LAIREALAVRRLKQGEERLWQEYARSVQPLKGRADPLPAPGPDPVEPVPPAALPASPPPPAQARRKAGGPVLPPPSLVPPVAVGQREHGLDDTSWRALSTGRLRPERRLDLHGQKAQAAFQLLHAFLQRAHAERLRCVEIITGAGSGPEGGILRRELPHWLSRPDLRHLVLAAVHPHRANLGSVRLLLRRRGGSTRSRTLP